MKTRLRRRARRGFTLMEVLLVLAILVILSSLAVVSIVRMQKGAYQKTAKLQIEGYESAATAYYLDVGQFPNTLEDLIVAPADLANPQKWKGPYIDDQLQTDPWGRNYNYAKFMENEDERVKIWSMGPNGIDGDTDDISNI